MAASVVQDTKEKGVKYVSTYYNNNLWSRNYPSLTPTEKRKKKENVWYQKRFTTKMLRTD